MPTGTPVGRKNADFSRIRRVAAGEIIAEYPWSPLWRGSGMQDDPYVIKTTENLFQMILWSVHNPFAG